jgi:RNA polymerase sigma factor (sigma-70 family)
MADLDPVLQRAICRAVRRLRRSSPPPNWDHTDWREELLREAILAGLEAEQAFDPHRGVSLEQFAYHRICAHLKTFRDRERRYQRAVVAFAEDEETGEVWEPVDEQSEEGYRQVEARMVVEYLLGQLEEWEYQLWVWVEQRRSYRWIGQRLGISHTMARKRWQQLQTKLQALLAGSGQGGGVKVSKRRSRGNLISEVHQWYSGQEAFPTVAIRGVCGCWALEVRSG